MKMKNIIKGLFKMVILVIVTTMTSCNYIVPIIYNRLGNDILIEFHDIDKTFSNTVEVLEKCNLNSRKLIEINYLKNPNNSEAKLAYEKAIKVVNVANRSFSYFADMKSQLINQAGGRYDNVSENPIVQASNINLHLEFMIEKGVANEMKSQIELIRNEFLALTPKGNYIEIRNNQIESDLNQSWDKNMFDKKPLVAVITEISKIQIDILCKKTEILNSLENLTITN